MTIKLDASAQSLIWSMIKVVTTNRVKGSPTSTSFSFFAGYY
jgi:hypothetical protein